MAYDENSFLQGIAVGMAMKGVTAGGGSSALTVSTETGCSVYLKLGGVIVKTYTLGADEDECTFYGLSAGVSYTVAIEKNGLSNEKSIYIDSVGLFEIFLEFPVLLYRGSDYGEPYCDGYVYQGTQWTGCTYSTAKIYGTQTEAGLSSRYVVFTRMVRLNFHSRVKVVYYANASTQDEFIVARCSNNITSRDVSSITTSRAWFPEHSTEIRTNYIDLSGFENYGYIAVRCKKANEYIYEVTVE